MKPANPPNEEVADVLERVAELLEAQDASPYRVRAYRRAARLVESLPQPIRQLVNSNEDKKLEELPGIGPSIGGSIRKFVLTGRLGLLERLEGQVSAEDLFTTVPGIGEELAHRIHTELGIDTLEEMELAAHDGRLEKVTGIGERRIRGIRGSLEAMLSRSSRRRAKFFRHMEKERDEHGEPATPMCPPVSVILAVDEEYRQKVNAGELKSIVPRRFNPGGKSRLPILHTERNGWHFTVLFSNTARAHELGKTRDWVVVYFERDGYESQCTVITEYRGPLKGERVVRGYDPECLAYSTPNL